MDYSPIISKRPPKYPLIKPELAATKMKLDQQGDRIKQGSLTLTDRRRNLPNSQYSICLRMSLAASELRSSGYVFERTVVVGLLRSSFSSSPSTILLLNLLILLFNNWTPRCRMSIGWYRDIDTLVCLVIGRDAAI